MRTATVSYKNHIMVKVGTLLGVAGCIAGPSVTGPGGAGAGPVSNSPSSPTPARSSAVAPPDAGVTAKSATNSKLRAPIVTSVTISPRSASLYAGRTKQFTATMKDRVGKVVSGELAWTTSNSKVATVSRQGVVTAVAAGSAEILGVSNGRSGEASVSVTRLELTAVSVSPSSLTLSAGRTTQLVATLHNQNGGVTGGGVSWTTSDASVASVSATGLVTSKAAGTATITAAAGDVKATSSVTVSAQASYHEPSGMATQINTGTIGSLAAATVFSPTTRSSVGEWAGNLTLVPGGTGLRVNYPTDLAGGGYSPVRFGFGIPSAGTGWYYQRMKVRFSSNWTLNGNGSVKLCEPRTQQHGSGQDATENHVIGAHVNSSGWTDAFLYVLLQGPNGHFENLTEQPEYNSGANLAGGAWHLVEVLFTPESTPGAGNGTYTGWVDGVQVAHWTSVLWLARGNKVGWPYLMFDPTYGGGTHSPPHAMYWDFDELYVSTR